MLNTPVRKLTNENLLNEYSSLERWAGNDFAVHSITANMIRRKEADRKEILRRMRQNRNPAEGC